MTEKRKPAPPAIPPQLITVQEAARRCSLGARSIWRLVAQGKMPKPIRFTRKIVRFHAPTLEAYLAQLRQGVPPCTATSALGECDMSQLGHVGQPPSHTGQVADAGQSASEEPAGENEAAEASSAIVSRKEGRRHVAVVA